MPKKINPKVKQRCIRPALDHIAAYPNTTATAQVVVKRNGVGAESVCRWCLQAQIDSSQRDGSSSDGSAEIKNLKAKVRRLDEDDDILRPVSIFLAGEFDPPRGLIVAFSDECHQAGHVVGSIGRVLTPQRCQVVARTYRAWASSSQGSSVTRW